ncbi:hypothetical protein QVD17_15913 [Tagetes erecta]|uniref:AIPP2-like SPOC-like domain-containing protein n=1 Tax=Tagetes erecta TaxID=13708 RepID=A0AAD8NT24_TARER|nr:hypothetical protein QVD17_15913 [Tagetes erecta]
MTTPCDICGDPGVIEAIITCCQCKVAHEHLYCMRVFTIQAPPFWRCEECVENKQVPSVTTDKEQKIQTVSSIMPRTTLVVEGPNKKHIASHLNFKEKRVDKGKTKYLSCDEAVKLSSGSMKPNYSPNKESHSAHAMSKSVLPLRVFQPSTGSKGETVPECYSPTRERTPIKSPQEERRFKPNLQQPVFQQSSSPKGKAVLPFQNRGNVTPPATSSVPSRGDQRTTPEREMKTTNTDLPTSKKEADISRHIEVPKLLVKLEKTETQSGCKNYADMEAGRSDAGKPDLTCGLPVSKICDPYVPSLNSYWKGSFHLSNWPQKFNDAFKAHPPSRIHYKVHETLMKMPENICFELVPHHEIRLEIFPADRDDIALYFFPRFKRSEDDLSIIDFIWRQNLVMKSNVDGVELLVLSSRVLPSHSQEFQGNYFLWGVFRCLKTVKKVAAKRPLTEEDRKPFDDVPPGFKKIHADVSLDFKKTCDDVPPGFEKICKP